MPAYADATSCEAGGTLRLTLTEDSPVTVHDATDDRLVHTGHATAPAWDLTIPQDWPSSLYRAEVAGDEVWFVVRARTPAAPILVSVPFPTWLAYHRAGVPGESLYYFEEAGRADRVSFDRPGIGPPPERWEEGLLRWLRQTGYAADFCSGLDLHQGGPELLRDYRLLVVNGHDEYWSKEMRDAVEAFVDAGGNLACFAANTAYWQARFEDGGRTMVCYRDAVRDPLAAVDPARATVEWSAAPVHRPENAMTGVSYRHGAGAWGDFMDVMKETEYTARFAAHWVFAGTGLRDGDGFALGAVGYETDAALFAEDGGVPAVTGGDGTPPSFVVLATADLRHWRRYGQGGHATMGVFRRGAGTVFTAATVNWGASLGDPVTDRITRNVLDRLSAPPGPPPWDVIGPAPELVALAACEHAFWAIDASGVLLVRRASGQNVPWWPVTAGGEPPLCLAAPREAVSGRPVGLYGVTERGRLLHRPPVREPAAWAPIGAAPPGTRALAVADGRFFAVTADDRLWCAPIAEPDGWVTVGDGGGVTTLTAVSGLLVGAGPGGRIRMRRPVPGTSGTSPGAEAWENLGYAAGRTVLAGYEGRLVGAGPDGRLAWRETGREINGESSPPGVSRIG
ncbi:DUF6605 domain-containing protein [Dactylosporangium sp. AC04546]|uniref:N,N-dimethylformamidase beta subunit family domain-containing protein n=1 Tax=Dactylosporangium sp. AC04546 TaxID=2862460 RepID=UPI001EDE0A3E|nr:N,N-dimethylformamidase beta subunit family domain-containing protein [Dactylosporangium sp. AC04546]WVK86160.1 DUF6605 domain-containing protein [Dactylosporangium sp. AC04546]